MHCPNCGMKASGDQKFCRSCGLSLDKVHQLLGEELSTVELNLQHKLRRVERWRNAVGKGAFAAIALVLLVVFTREIKLDIEKGSSELWPTVIGLVILIGLIATLLLVTYSASLRERLTSGRQRTDEVSGTTTTTRLPLEAGHEEMTSVTERTTELIEADRSKQK